MVDRLRGPAGGCRTTHSLGNIPGTRFSAYAKVLFVYTGRGAAAFANTLRAHNQLPALISLTTFVPYIYTFIHQSKTQYHLPAPSLKTTKPPPPHGRIILFARRCRWNFALSITNSHSPCRPSFSFQATTALAFAITIKRSSFSSSHLKVNVSIT